MFYVKGMKMTLEADSINMWKITSDQQASIAALGT